MNAIESKLKEIEERAAGLKSNFWKMKIETAKHLPILKPLRKPCHDCAVTTGFYIELSEDLKNQPIEIQKEVSDKWFCHNHTQRSCRGNLSFLSLLTEDSSGKAGLG